MAVLFLLDGMSLRLQPLPCLKERYTFAPVIGAGSEILTLVQLLYDSK